MYIPKSKYKIQQAASGQYQTEDGVPYAGPIIKTSLGSTFAGRTLSDFSIRLIPAPQQAASIVVDDIYNEYITPTQADYERGYFIRYLLYNTKNNKIAEVSEKQYKRRIGSENIRSGKLQWVLIETSDKNISKTASSRNKKQVDNLSSYFPEVSLIIKDYNKFVVGS